LAAAQGAAPSSSAGAPAPTVDAVGVTPAPTADGVGSVPEPTADAVVAGLANGYMQYVTTPEEYERQRYEGGATLYGPASGPYLAEVMAALAQHLLGRSNEAALARM